MSAYTPHLLMERGIKYDHSQMHSDFEPYWMRINEEWTLIDYSKPAKSWMKPMKKGTTFPSCRSRAAGTSTTCRR